MKTKMFFVILTLTIGLNALAQPQKWDYDAGPDLNTNLGKELVDLTADIPNMPAISKEIIDGKQKFRPAFGPIPWRMRQEENKVKMLFIGQDGTHIAEAAGRPATAGFGGRAQDLAKYFGVREGAAFINTYAFTIKGQYGIYNTPYIYQRSGENQVFFSNLVSNKLWLISQHLESPIVKWRNDLIDWIIKNNRKSMKLIVLFGGAARDAIATYARSKGAEVAAYADDQMPYIQVPQTKEEYAGGNNTFPSIRDRKGRDLYAKMVGKKLKYSNAKDQTAAVDSLEENVEEYVRQMVFTKGGPYGNGLLNAAQLGGYNLSKMIINGMRTRSLKGLQLNDGTIIENDIIVVELPHPSSLTKTVRGASSYSEGKRLASQKVMRKVKALNFYAAKGWKIEADPGMVNHYAVGEDYEYGRSDIGPEFYDFGTPANRMVSKSSAKRMSGAANVVIIGTRENGQFDRNLITKMTNAKPAFGIEEDNLYIARPSNTSSRYQYDAGPGEEIAKIMKDNLNLSEILEAKEGMSWDENGIDAFNIKTHPSVKDFGHYRGTFKNPRALILADPSGFDDIITARALTGTRGQYIQGMMNDLGIEDKYLVIKTVPFGMDGADQMEWEKVLEQTQGYREAVLKKILENGRPEFILTDGQYAKSEALRILADAGIPIITMYRKEDDSTYGIGYASYKINQILETQIKVKPRMDNIPRTHLSFYSRTWEGTSGDRVITSEGKEYKGLAFAEVVPSWAYKQKAPVAENQKSDMEAMVNVLRDNDLILPYESIPRYLERTGK